MRRSLRKMSWRRATSLVVSIAIVMTFLTAMSTNAVGREEAGLQLEDVTMVATPNTFITNGSTFACKISYKMPLDLSGYTEQVLVVTWPGGLTVQGNVTFTIGGGAPIAAGTTMTPVYNYTLTGSNFQSAAGLVVEFTINYRLLGWITGRPIPINAALASKPVGDDYATDAELSVTVSPRFWDAGSVTVTYVGTGSDTGNPPVDSNSPYKAGDPVKVLGNTGTPKLEKTGYEFAGWERDIVPNRLVSEYAIAELAPGWTITGTGEPGYELTIRYYTSNNTPITQTSSGQPLTNITTVVGADGRWAYTLPAWLQNEAMGWRFTGDYTVGQPTTIDCDADDEFDMLHNNIVFRPKWEEITSIPHIVTYKANGGTGADFVDDVVFGQLYTILGSTLFTAPTGKELAGWNTEEDGTGTAYAAGAQITIAGDLVLYAIWVDIPITSIKIDAGSLVTVIRLHTYNFSVILNDGASAENIIWSVSHSAYATVTQDGTVTTKNATGSFTLTATDPISGLSHSITLRVQ